MARQNAIRISKRTVDVLTVETGDALFWDRELAGFGVRVYATGRKVYVVQMQRADRWTETRQDRPAMSR